MTRGRRIVAFSFLIVFLWSLLATFWLYQTRNRPVSEEGISVYFSPKGGCTDAVVNAIAGAKSRVRILAYSFTSAPIAEAVVAAHDNGRDVEVILDESQRTEKYSSATFLKNHGIPVFIDETHAIAHNKVVIVDDDVVVSGSFNFTKAAQEHNAENLLVIRGRKRLVAAYLADFEKHRGHAVRMK